MLVKKKLILLTTAVTILCSSAVFAALPYSTPTSAYQIWQDTLQAKSGDVISIQPKAYTFTERLFVKPGVTLNGISSKTGKEQTQPIFYFKLDSKDFNNYSAIHICTGGTVDNLNITLMSKDASRDHSYRVIYNKGTIENCLIAGGNLNSANFSIGAGILNYGIVKPGTSKLIGGIVDNCVVANCVATLGGGIYNSSGSVEDCTVLLCGAPGADEYDPGCGGGIYNSNGAVDNCTVQYCFAGNDGGGIESYGGTITYNDDSFHSINSCKAQYGGGIELSHGATLNIKSCASNKISNDVIISRNIATHSGGGILNRGTITVSQNYRGTFYIAYNIALSNGGGIYNAGTFLNNSSNKVIVQKNTAGSPSVSDNIPHGGGVYNAVDYTIRDCKIIN
jgi:hypothetical protein